MIVDLLRNDIGRIAEIGSVRVPELFTVESYATVHQMVSRVTGRLVPGTRLSRVFAALFPCGSVTGAPKLRAMEIIRELEPWPREAYCGAIGWAAPDGRACVQRGDPHASRSIRAARRSERGRRARRGLERGVGVRGGLVESALRGSAPADLKLIETLRWEPGAGFVRLAGASRAAGGRSGGARDRGRARGDRAGAGGGGRGRGAAGAADAGARRAGGGGGGAARPGAAGLDRGPGGRARSTRAIRGWRSSRRERRRHDAARGALPPGVDEAVFLNERGEVCEGTITNVFVDVGAGLVTPPLTSGLLARGAARRAAGAGGVPRGGAAGGGPRAGADLRRELAQGADPGAARGLTAAGPRGVSARDFSRGAGRCTPTAATPAPS